MNLLLHICCAPCAIIPTKYLQQNSYNTTLFFYNPNIHPYREFKKRMASVKDFALENKLPLIIEKQYRLNDFIRAVVFRENRRCSVCQEMRIKETVITAKNNGFSSFSTSLLYSKYQNHEEIRNQCAYYSERSGLEFVYHDFRIGWEEGIKSAISKGLYRQSYCGCIFSEHDRYNKDLRKGKKNDCNDSSCHQ